MHLLRKPRTTVDITPQLLGAMIDNLNKLQRLSATGATVMELPGGLAIEVPPPKEQRRGRLLESLYGCATAKAVEIVVGPDGSEADGQLFIVFDPLNKTSAALIAVQDARGDFYLPAGTCFDSHWRTDSQRWELDDPGNCCTAVSGSGGSGGLHENAGRECGVPCPPTGCAMRWEALGDGSGCSVLICCSGSGGSGVQELDTTLVPALPGPDPSHLGWVLYTDGISPPHWITVNQFNNF